MGPAGPAGAAGPQGLPGNDGAQGPAGPAGAQGPQGIQGATGATGATGAQGAVGPVGPEGPVGPQGPQGPQGADGQAGATGAQGPAGPAGPAGPQGPAGLVNTVFVEGQTAALTPAFQFLGPPSTVTVAAGQRIHIVSMAGLGAGATAATGLDIVICHRIGATGNPIADTGGIFGLTSPANQRHVFSLTADLALPANTYQVGMCGRAATPANWNNNEWGSTTAFVHN